MIGTILVGAVLFAVVGGIVWSMVRNHRQGKGSCGGDCSKCRGCRTSIGVVLLSFLPAF